MVGAEKALHPNQAGVWGWAVGQNQTLSFNSLNGGIEDGAVSARSGGRKHLVSAGISISMAWPALAGAKTVAASSPLRTHDCPVLGKPSQPVKGNLSQRSRSDSLASS